MSDAGNYCADCLFLHGAGVGYHAGSSRGRVSQATPQLAGVGYHRYGGGRDTMGGGGGGPGPEIHACIHTCIHTYIHTCLEDAALSNSSEAGTLSQMPICVIYAYL